MPSDAIRDAADVIGKRTSESIISGEVISSKRFLETSNSFTIPDNFCAVSVPAKDVQAVGGSVAPGMYIDMYATGQTGTTLLAENVLVLATNNSSTTSTSKGASSTSSSGNTSSNGSGSTYSSSTQSTSWITVAVPLENVESVVGAAQSSSLYFVIPGEQTENSSASDSSVNGSGADKASTTGSTVSNTSNSTTNSSSEKAKANGQ